MVSEEVKSEEFSEEEKGNGTQYIKMDQFQDSSDQAGVGNQQEKDEIE